MVKIKWVKDFQLRDKEDIRDGCDIQVIEVSEHNKMIKEINDYHDQRWKIRDQYMKDEMIKKSELKKEIEKLEEDLQEFQNFGQKSKVIVRLNQTKKRLGIDG